MPKNRIHKDKSGRYSYKVTSSRGERLHLKSRKDESLKEFKLRCDALDERAESGSSLSNVDLDTLFNQWIEGHVKINLSPSEFRVTVPIYEQNVKPYLGHRKADDISRADVYSLLARAAKSGKSASYVKKIRGCISRPYNWGINVLGLDLIAPTQGLIFTMPYSADEDDINIRSRAISVADMERFMEAAKASKYYRYFRILAHCGYRPSEALGLQAGDRKEDLIEIRRGWTIDGPSKLKTRASVRNTPLTAELNELFKDQVADTMFLSKERWLFPSSNGKPSMSAIQSAFRNIVEQTAVWKRGGRNGLKKLDLIKGPVEFTLYDFRHTFATRMADLGAQPTALKMLMGHSDITITLKYYVSVTEKMKDETKKLMAL